MTVDTREKRMLIDTKLFSTYILYVCGLRERGLLYLLYMLLYTSYMKHISPVENLPQLIEILHAAGIDTSLFGKGSAKTLKDLKKEIDLGESILLYNANNELIRCVEIVTADVFYRDDNGNIWQLKEEKQIFKDGRIKIRVREKALSEKVRPGENSHEAIRRGLKEELGISPKEIERKEKSLQSFISWSYPGLQSTYISHHFIVEIEEKDFHRDGYREEQEEKTIYFVWEKQ